MDRLAALEPEAPVGDDGEAEQPRQHQAALVGDQVHDREVELLLLEAGEQPRVLQHHLAVDVGDAVEVGGQLVRVVSLVPDDRSLHSRVITWPSCQPAAASPLTRFMSLDWKSNSPLELM